MRKVQAFALRCVREILRDPLSYIFCIGFPLVMLAIMTLVDRSIPPQAGMTLFRIDNLCGGVLFFALTFVMLFTAMTVAKDRSGAFLVRMYATPMTAMDFTQGYLLPMLVIALVQGLLICLAASLIGLVTGNPLSAGGLLLALAALIPASVLMIAFGLLFGTLFNEKAAPGICSIIISLGSFLGSVWFDAEATGGVLLRISRCLPFHYCTKSLRAAIKLDLTREAFFAPLLVVCACAALVLSLAAVVFRRRMRADLA